jgi:hypothetical protein
LKALAWFEARSNCVLVAHLTMIGGADALGAKKERRID